MATIRLPRSTTEFPVTVFNGATWPTNWQLGGAVRSNWSHPCQNHHTSGWFGKPLPHGFARNQRWSRSFPASATRRQRNIVRGPGYAGLDMGLSKRWQIHEAHSVLFRWEVFNVPNLKRFDVVTITSGIKARARIRYLQRLARRSARDAGRVTSFRAVVTG